MRENKEKLVQQVIKLSVADDHSLGDLRTLSIQNLKDIIEFKKKFNNIKERK